VEQRRPREPVGRRDDHVAEAEHERQPRLVRLVQYPLADIFGHGGWTERSLNRCNNSLCKDPRSA
jgi:hypothetical protein